MRQDCCGTKFLAHRTEDNTREQTILEHLEGTARRAAEFGAAFGAMEQAELAGMLHDIGKYSHEFQHRLQGASLSVDHSTAGSKEAGKLGQHEVAFAVAGHHSGIPDGGSATDNANMPTLMGRLKKSLPDYSAWTEDLSDKLHTAKRPPQIPFDNQSEAFYIRMLYSCLVDADFLDTETFMTGAAAPRGGYDSIPTLFQRLKQYIAPWMSPETALNQKRCKILQRCLAAGKEQPGGLYTLTVPTGGGKTISSLAFALAHAQEHKKSRVIYVIPYTSIIDQTTQKFREVLGDENVLEHHSGADYSAKEDPVSPALYRHVLATENWDAPVIVTTAVQFFESLYSNRSSRCRKLHNIANSVVVFDEAQTLPVQHLRPCVESIGQLVQYYRVTAVLCTATQPALQPLFSELAPRLSMQEICPDTQDLYSFFRRTTLHLGGTMTEESLADSLNNQTQTLCVVNRRSSAQKIFASLKPNGRYCLTTLLCPSDRKRLLQEIRARLKDGNPCRVVSTSLIEAGVDVDFPTAWREKAGLDSILQTAGRCNREGTRPVSESLVTIFQLEGQRPPAMLCTHLEAADNVLKKFPDPASPEAIEEYFTFFRKIKGDSALDQQAILSAFQKGIKGCVLPFAQVSEKFHLIESPTIPLYIPMGDGQPLVEMLQKGLVSRDLYRKLGQYAVNVYPDHLKTLLDLGAVQATDSGTYILEDMTLYSAQTGLLVDVESGRGIFA